MVLQNERMSIRTWTFHDDELLDDWPPYNDPTEPLWNLPRRAAYGGDQWGQFFEGSGMRRTWAVEDRSGRLIGRISLRDIDNAKAQARLGITFGAPYIGRGLGTDALGLFLDHYFTDLGFLALLLDVAAPNQRAVRAYERLGFSYIGGDWRQADSRFDGRILSDPHYAQIHRFFRQSQRGLEVEFFEMRLLKEEWVGRQWRHRVR